MPHARSLPLALLVTLALSAAPARAATVSYGTVPFPIVTFTADANEDNSLSIAQSGTNVVLTDTGTKAGNPITITLQGQPAIDNCQVSGAGSTVTCPAGVLSVALGDLDDDATTSYGAAAIIGFAVTISGDAGNDTLTSTAPATAFSPFASVSLNGGSEDDVLTGGPGVDALNGGDGADRLRGGGGDDFVVGGPGNDPELDGQAGNDSVQGGGGVDVLLGGDGDDALDDNDGGAPGPDRVDGGNGTDLVSYTRSAPVTVTLADDPGAAATGNDGQAGEGDAVRQVESVSGGSAGDHLVGSPGANQLTGAGGADTIQGGDGDDVILGGDGDDPALDGEGGTDSVDGGPGDDSVSGGDGDDRSPVTGCLFATAGVFGGDGNDTVDGGAGNDSVCGGGVAPSFSDPGQDLLRGGPGVDVLDDMDAGNPGPDRLDGGDGRDVGVWNRTGDVSVTLGDDPGPDALSGNDGVAGENDAARALEGATTSTGNDTIVGTGGEDRIDTGAGNDTVDAAGGDDWILGGAGNDGLTGGDGEDEINGAGGGDALAGGNGDDVLDDGDGAAPGGEPDSLDGGPGGDLVRSYQLRQAGILVDLAAGTGGEPGEGDRLLAIEHVLGGQGDDQLLGSADGNELTGGVGNDAIDGRAGSDSVQGEGGNDSLVGGPGIDELRGGRGADSLDGRDSGVDQLGCGADVDVATGDTGDAIDLDCETITKAAATAAPIERTVSCAQAKKPRGKGSRRRYSITCTVDPNAPKGARATLKRGKRTVALGTINRNRVTFKVKRRQKAGRYTFDLTIAGKTTRFTVRLK